MKTNGNASPNWELSNSQRYVRGIIGAATLTAVLLVPGLSEGWLFLLAIIGAYEGMTAIFNADLVYGVLSLVYAATPAISHEESEEEGTTAPLITAGEQQGYSMVA